MSREQEISEEMELAIRRVLLLVLTEGEDVTSGVSVASTMAFRFVHMGNTYGLSTASFPINVTRFVLITSSWEVDLSFGGPSTHSAKNKITGGRIRAPMPTDALPMFAMVAHYLNQRRDMIHDEKEVLAVWLALFGTRVNHPRIPSHFKGDLHAFQQDFLVMKMDDRFKDFPA